MISSPCLAEMNINLGQMLLVLDDFHGETCGEIEGKRCFSREQIVHRLEEGQQSGKATKNHSRTCKSYINIRFFRCTIYPESQMAMAMGKTWVEVPPDHRVRHRGLFRLLDVVISFALWLDMVGPLGFCFVVSKWFKWWVFLRLNLLGTPFHTVGIQSSCYCHGHGHKLGASHPHAQTKLTVISEFTIFSWWRDG